MPTTTDRHGVGLTGGCQCGALRYEITAPIHHASICHCRMCQKATGQPYFASATPEDNGLRWTRGTPARFRSSSIAERLFCAQCGTPIAFVDAEGISVAMATFDDPEAIRPDYQIGIEARLSWWRGDGLADGETTEQHSGDLAREMQNFQHPDAR